MTPQQDTVPAFVGDYEIEDVGQASIAVRHRTEGHRWRFEVAEKNGRRQLLHAAHMADPDAARDIEQFGVDAYDAATREARLRGLID